MLRPDSTDVTDFSSSGWWQSLPFLVAVGAGGILLILYLLTFWQCHHCDYYSLGSSPPYSIVLLSMPSISETCYTLAVIVCILSALLSPYSPLSFKTVAFSSSSISPGQPTTVSCSWPCNMNTVWPPATPLWCSVIVLEFSKETEPGGYMLVHIRDLL